MSLQEIPSLESIYSSPQFQSYSDEEKIKAIDLWKSDVRKQTDIDFSSPSDWKMKQESYKFSDEQADKYQQESLTRLVSDSLANKFSSKEDFDKFQTEFREKGNNYLLYSSRDYGSVARDIYDIERKYPKSKGVLSSSDAIEDPNGNHLGRLDIQYNGKGSPQYANIYWRDIVEDSNLGQASQYAENVYSGLTGQENDAFASDMKQKAENEQGDTVRFPDNFDGKIYGINSIKKSIEDGTSRIAELEDQLEALSSPWLNTDDGRGDAMTRVSIAAELETAKSQLLRNQQELTKRENDPDYAQRQGDLAYVKDYVGRKVEFNDPRYANFGQSLMEGIGAAAWKEIKAQAYGPGTYIWQALDSVKEELPFGLGSTAVFSEFAQSGSQKIKEINAAETQSRISTYDTSLANTIDNTVSALTQGVTIPAQSLLIGTKGLAAAQFLTQAGRKIAEVDDQISRLRQEGDNESANHLEKNKFAIANFAGGIESIVERFSPTEGFSGTSFGNGFTKSFSSMIFGTMAEGGEEVIANTLQAGSDLAFGVIDESGFLQAINNSNEAFLLGMVGAVPANAVRVSLNAFQNAVRNRALANQQRSGIPSTPSQVTDILGRHFTDLNQSPSTPTTSDAQNINSVTEKSAQKEQEIRTKRAGATIPNFSTDDRYTVGRRVRQQGEVSPPTTDNTTIGNTITRVKSGDVYVDGELDRESVTETPTVDTAVNAVGPTPQEIEEDTKKTGELQASSDVLEDSEGNPGDSQQVDDVKVVPSYGTTEDLRVMGQLYTDEHQQRIEELGGPENVTVLVGVKTPEESENPDVSHGRMIYTYSNDPDFQFQEDSELGSIREKLNDPAFPISELSMEERAKIAEDLRLGGLLPSAQAARNGAVVGDRTGRAEFIRADVLLKMVENGEVDPNNDFLYWPASHPLTNEMNSVYEKWNSNNLLAKNIGVGTVLAPTRSAAAGWRVQSKAVEQQLLSSTNYGIETVTIGGGLSQDQSGLTDLNEDNGLDSVEKPVFINNPLTGEDLNVTARVLTPAGKRELVNRLDKKFGEKNWILKPNIGLQSKGRIIGNDPNSYDSRGFLKDDIVMHPDSLLVAQPLIEGDNEYRVVVRTDANGRLNILSGAVIDKAIGSDFSKTVFPSRVISKDHMSKIIDMVDGLQNTELNTASDTVYGLDVIIDNEGNPKILELNPADEYGIAGQIDIYGQSARSLIGDITKTKQFEDRMAEVAYLRATGQVEIANRIFEEAVTQTNQEGEGIPNAQELKQQRVLYSVTETTTASNQADVAFIENYNIDGSSSDTTLEAIADNSPDPDHRVIADEMLRAARFSNSAGLKTRVKIVPIGDKNLEGAAGIYFFETKEIYSTPDSEIILHEVGHAIMDGKIPEWLNVSNYDQLTGAEYFALLQRGLNDPEVSPQLKNLIADYIAAVEATEQTGKIFSNKRILKGPNVQVKDVEYGLTTLQEFFSEMFNGNLKSTLSSIDNVSALNAFRRLIESALDYVRSFLFNNGSPAKNLWDKSFADLIDFVKTGDLSLSRKEADLIRANNYNIDYTVSNLKNQREALTDSKRKNKGQLLGKLNRDLANASSSHAATIVKLNDGISVTDIVSTNTVDNRTAKGLDPYHRSFEEIANSLSDGYSLGTVTINGWEYPIILSKGEFTGKNNNAVTETTKLPVIDVTDKKSVTDYLSSIEQRFADQPNDSPSPPVKQNYKVDGVQRVNGEVVFTMVTILEPGHPFNESSICVYGEATDRNIRDHIEAKRNSRKLYSRKKKKGEAQTENDNQETQDNSLAFISGIDSIDDRRAAIVDMVTSNRINNKDIDLTKVSERTRRRVVQNLRDAETDSLRPSDIVEKELNDAQSESNATLIKKIIQLYPSAFDRRKNPQFKEEPNTPQEAEFIVIDWLSANPSDDSTLSGIKTNKPAKAALRRKLSKQFSYYMNRLKRFDGSGRLMFLDNAADTIQEEINYVIDYFTNQIKASNITNRQLTAFNLAMKQFINSNGKVVRGFAPIYKMIMVQNNIKSVTDYYENNKGGRPLFGDPISDLVNKFPGFSKTGSNLSDRSTEVSAIFPTDAAMRVWSKLVGAYRYGVSQYKRMYKELSDTYDARLKAIGDTTQLEDMRIWMASLTTQFNDGQTDQQSANQIRSVIRMIDSSITRKENAGPEKRGILNGWRTSRWQRIAPIEREAYNQTLSTIVSDPNYSNLTTNQLVDRITQLLNPKEQSILTVIREPGNRWFNDLNLVNQMGHNKPLDRINNYVRRSQQSLNGERPTMRWGQDAVTSPASVLEERTDALGDGMVLNSNWRANFYEQLNETAYEVSTGVNRIALFDTLNDDTFARLIDSKPGGGWNSATERRDRLRRVIGNTHANIKNPRLRFGRITAAGLWALRAGYVTKLISLKAAANQLIPLFSVTMQHPQISAEVAINMSTSKNNRRNVNRLIGRIAPDLLNRMSNFDELLDRYEIDSRFQKSGMPQLTTSQKIMESAMKGAKYGSASLNLLGKIFVDIPVQVTNGFTEQLSAKHAFITVYASELLKNGAIQNIDQLFNINFRYDSPEAKRALAAAYETVDKYILAPINVEDRSEFSQRNSLGKILANLITFNLARTRIQQSLKAMRSVNDLYNSVTDYFSQPNPQNRERVSAAAKDFSIAATNILTYSSIAFASRKLFDSMFTSTEMVADAIMAGEPEDEDYWKRRLIIGEKIERDNQLKFIKAQLATDAFTALFPFVPALAQTNVANSVISDFMQQAVFSDSEKTEVLEEDLKNLRKQRDDLARFRKQLMKSGLITPDSMDRINKAEEYNRYGIEQGNQLLKTLNDKQFKIHEDIEIKQQMSDEKKDRVVQFFERAIKNTTPIWEGNSVRRFFERDEIPADISNFILGGSTTTQETRRIMDESRKDYSLADLETYINPIIDSLKMRTQEQRTAKNVRKEWSRKRVEEAQTEKQRREEILKTVEMLKGVK